MSVMISIWFWFNGVKKPKRPESSMQRKVSWGDDGGIVAKADRVAAALSKSVICDGVYISLANRNRLFSFGMTGADGPEDKKRIHEFADTVCSITIARNTRHVLDDARNFEGFSTIPYVVHGNIVAYLGQPIRDAETNAIGAICAVSAEKRIWSEADILNLQLSCMETEYLLTTELLQHEMSYLSQALGKYDGIVMALTNNMRLMTSVHSETGELLFATKALLEEVDATSLEGGFCQYQRTSKILEHSAVRSSPGQPSELHHKSELTIRGRSEKARYWHATIQNCPGAVTYVSWKSAPDKLQ